MRDASTRTGCAVGTFAAFGAAVLACGTFTGNDTPVPSPEPTDAGAVADASASSADGGTTALDAGHADDASSLPECTAQRSVHLVGDIGGLAWFTLIWPVPDMIDTFSPSDAYDDPSLVRKVALAPHPLYIRATGGMPVFGGTGANPFPTVMVAGKNTTHTPTPAQTQTAGLDMIAAGALAQADMNAVVPVFLLGANTTIYTASKTQPSAFVAADPGAAITELTNRKMAGASALAPDAATLGTWYSGNASMRLQTLAANLLFAARAFAANAAGTFVMPAFEDDPHGAFSSSVTPAADNLASVLQHFYALLATLDEPTCSHQGKRISLADNVVLVVTGDTPKDPYSNAGWPDNTPGGANWIYVRSNGYLVPGWFGAVTSNSAAGFDPTTGSVAGPATAQAGSDAAALAILYAITRGNNLYVSTLSAAPYIGLVAPKKP